MQITNKHHFLFRRQPSMCPRKNSLLNLFIFRSIIRREKLAVDTLPQLCEPRAGTVSGARQVHGDNPLDGPRPGRHDDDAVGQEDGFVDIMRHQDHRRLLRLPDA